jgi:hypothetical protein
MKFFTMDWWCGLQVLESYDPLTDFQKHLTTIRDRVPTPLLALQETVSLLDARLRLLECDYDRKTLTMHFDGDNGAGDLRQFVLRYIDVSKFRTLADPEKGLPGPHGYGDLGYDEPDVTVDGEFEHRLLFSTGIEFEIVFGNLILEWNDAK